MLQRKLRDFISRRQERYVLKALFLVFCVLISCKKENREEREVDSPGLEIYYSDITRPAIVKADSILTGMTLEERIGQCLMPSIMSETDSATLQKFRKYIEDYHVGGVVLLQGNVASATKLAELGGISGVPLFIAIDAEWGLGMRLKEGKVYPKNGIIGKETDETTMFDYGREVTEECRKIGINMVLGPVVDIASGGNNIIGKRSFGPDAIKVSDYGIAYAKGLESGGVVSVAKHFPGQGGVKSDTHSKVGRLDHGILELDSIDLLPFKNYIASGMTGIMAGHIETPAIDKSGKPASSSFDMLTSFLRGELEFKGLIITDAFDMGGAKDLTASEALQAGADIVLCPADIKKEYGEILENVNKGVLDIKIVNDRCRRILFVKALFGIV